MARREIVVSTMKATWAFFERRRRALVLLRPSVLHTTTVGTQVPGLGQLMRVQGGGPGTASTAGEWKTCEWFLTKAGLRSRILKGE